MAALAHVNVQRDIAVAVLGCGGCIEVVTDGLFFLSGLVAGGMLVLVVLPQSLVWCVSDPGTVRLAHLDEDVGCQVCDIAGE